MKFQVPQFIETEINIVGPFTLKQFLWIGAGATMLFLDFSAFSAGVAIIVGLPIAGVALAFAFLKIEGMPLINYVANALSFMFGAKRYLYTPEQSGDYSSQTKLRS
jgi:hypothetical protein